MDDKALIENNYPSSAWYILLRAFTGLVVKVVTHDFVASTLEKLLEMAGFVTADIYSLVVDLLNDIISGFLSRFLRVPKRVAVLLLALFMKVLSYPCGDVDAFRPNDLLSAN